MAEDPEDVDLRGRSRGLGPGQVRCDGRVIPRKLTTRFVAAAFVAVTICAMASPAAVLGAERARGADATRMLSIARTFLRISIVLGGGGRPTCPVISSVDPTWGLVFAEGSTQGAFIFMVRPQRASHRWLVFGWDLERVPKRTYKDLYSAAGSIC